MTRAAGHVAQPRRDLPSSGTYDEYPLLPLAGRHADRRDEIGVVRDQGRNVEKPVPSVVQEMGREIHVRPFSGIKLPYPHVLHCRDNC